MSIARLGNTLLRNENCGACVTSNSGGGVAATNLADENVNGLRWSQSVSSVGLDDQLCINGAGTWDLDSRGDGCGHPTAQLDVHRLHSETTAYAEPARQTLRGSPATKEHP